LPEVAAREAGERRAYRGVRDSRDFLDESFSSSREIETSRKASGNSVIVGQRFRRGTAQRRLLRIDVRMSLARSMAVVASPTNSAD
jgi:hypothetical protein